MLSNRSLYWLSGILGLILGLVIVFVIGYATHFSHAICNYDQASQHENCPRYSILPFAFVEVIKALNDYGAVVTGLATVAIAVFTYTLYIATTEQGRLTAKSIDIANRALTELEAPFIVVEIIESGLGFSAGEAQLIYCFANYGRTPASILELFDNVSFINASDKSFPITNPEITRGRPMPYGVFIPPSGKSDTFSLTIIQRYLQPNGLGPYKKHAHFCGFIRYSDIFGQVYILGFKFQGDPSRRRWVLMGDGSHNYCHKTSSPYVPPDEYRGPHSSTLPIGEG